LLGLGAGVVAAYFLNLTKPVFHNWRTLRDAIGVPVIGFVSEVANPQRRRDERKAILAFASGVAGLFLLCGIAIVLHVQHVFGL
jgi:hypothetical protein